MYKARLAENPYKAPTFEPALSDMWQLVSDCPTVGKLFSSQGGTSYISHSDSRLRTAVSEIDQIGKKYVGVKILGHLEMVRKGSHLEELADDDSPNLDPEGGHKLFAGDTYNLRKLLTYAMSRKQDIRITVDGPSAPAGTPKYQKLFHKKRIGKK